MLLALMLPAMVGAADRAPGYDDRDTRRSADSRAYRYDRSGRYVDWRVVRELAHDLEGWTRSAHREARRHLRDRYRDRYQELRAVDALDRLGEQARRFRREVDRSSGDRGDSRRDFYALRDAYRDASNSLHGLRSDRRVRELFGRVQDTMDRLAYHYGGSRRDDWRVSDRDRYDHRDR